MSGLGPTPGDYDAVGLGYVVWVPGFLKGLWVILLCKVETLYPKKLFLRQWLLHYWETDIYLCFGR